MQPQQKIETWLEENKITEVECLVPDMTGNARGKFISAEKFVKEDSRLPEGILAQTVTGPVFKRLLGASRNNRR